MFLLAGTISISALGFWLPKALTSRAEVYLLFVFFGVAVCTSIRVTVVPMAWVWLMATEHKRTAMALIDRKLPDLGIAPDSKSAAIEKWLSIYQAVSNASAFPFSTGVWYNMAQRWQDQCLLFLSA